MVDSGLDWELQMKWTWRVELEQAMGPTLARGLDEIFRKMCSQAPAHEHWAEMRVRHMQNCATDDACVPRLALTMGGEEASAPVLPMGWECCLC